MAPRQQIFAAVFQNCADGTHIEFLPTATTLEEARQAVKELVLDEAEQRIDEGEGEACWESIIGEGGEYEGVEEIFVITTHGSAGDLPADEWRSHIEDWLDAKSDEMEAQRKLEEAASRAASAADEFESAKNRYFELLEKQKDPSVSTATQKTRPTKKKIKKRTKKRAA